MATRSAQILCLAVSITVLNCGGGKRTTEPASAKAPTITPAHRALINGNFEHAAKLATDTVASQPTDAHAHAIRAIATYVSAVHHLLGVMMDAAAAIERGRGPDHAALHRELAAANAALTKVETDLSVASGDDSFALDLCVSCWKLDWDHSGAIDNADRVLEITTDRDGRALATDDPRKTPTFRFDVGDIFWARAMVAFQRGVISLVHAYDWRDLDKIIEQSASVLLGVTVRLRDKALVTAAQTLFDQGLAHARACRARYLSESDDVREWVPNPRQNDYAVGLPVDDALYAEWERVLAEIARVLNGEQGLRVASILALTGQAWPNAPSGFINIGTLLSKPENFRVPVARVAKLMLGATSEFAGIVRDILGKHYVEQMTPSPLIDRIKRLQTTGPSGEITFGRRIYYALWFN